MSVNLKACEHGEGMEALQKGVDILLTGVARTREGLLPGQESAELHQFQWHRFLEHALEPVKRTVFAAYRGSLAMRLEDVLAANQACLEAVAIDGREEASRDLASEVLRSTQGARHQKLLIRLAEAWEADTSPRHPAVSIAVKAAVFNEPLATAQVAYLFQEWRASGARCLHARGSSLEKFLERQPAELVSVSPSCLNDPHSPFGGVQHHG